MKKFWITQMLFFILFCGCGMYGFCQPISAITTPISVTVIEHTQANWDHPAEMNFVIPDGIIENGTVVITAYCDPDDGYLRAIYFSVDNRGGWIGVSAVGEWQTRGDTISPGQTVTREYQLSNTQFANDVTWNGAVFYDFLNQTVGSVGYLTPGNHTLKAFVSSQDKYQGTTQDSWISVSFKFNAPASDSSTVDDDNTNTNENNNIICILIIEIGVIGIIVVGLVDYKSKMAQRQNQPSIQETSIPEGNERKFNP